MQFCHQNRIWSPLSLALVLGFGLAGCVEQQAADKIDPAAVAVTDATTPTVGSVALLLTDAPSDDFSKINLTISRADLIADDGSKIPLFEGLRTIDLLSLRSTADLFAANHAVPPGLYEKIRLQLEDIELVKIDADGEEERIHPRLLANGKLDLNPRKPFVLAPGKSIVIQVDMDAAKSIHIVGSADHDEAGKGGLSRYAQDHSNQDKANDNPSKAKDDHSADSGAGNHQSDASDASPKHDSDSNGNRYHFRPVVFIDILEMTSTVPVGKVVRIEGDVSNIDIVNQRVKVCNIQNVLTNCVTMQANSKASLFGPNMESINLASLSAMERGIGFGRIRMVNGETWLDLEAMEFGPANTFWHVTGDVVGSPDASTNVFYFGIHAQQSYIPGSVFRIVPAAGAKLFSLNGVQLDWSALLVGQVVEVEGVMVRTPVNYTIEAGVVYLNVNVDAGGNLVSGSLAHFNSTGFNISTGSGDYCVVPNDAVNVFAVITGADGTLSGARETLDFLQLNQTLDLYGAFANDGCYHASDILVYL